MAEDTKLPVEQKNKNQSQKSGSQREQTQTRDDKNRDPNINPAPREDMGRDQKR
jgi:hypothetical protein